MGALAQGAVVLLVYLFCFVASILALAAVPSRAMFFQSLRPVASNPCFWGLMLYPLVYFVMAAISGRLSSNGRPLSADRVAHLPLLYLLGALLGFVAWMVAM